MTLRSLALLLGAAAVAGLLAPFPAPSTPGFGWATQGVPGACPADSASRADLGIRYRFVAGDFMEDERRPTWIHFLTEPVVVEVDPRGPAAGRLRPGDVVVAVDDYLITTREGSFRFWFNQSDSLTLRVLRGSTAMVLRIEPRTECVPV